MDSDGAWGQELIAICFEQCGKSQGSKRRPLLHNRQGRGAHQTLGQLRDCMSEHSGSQLVATSEVGSGGEIWSVPSVPQTVRVK